MSSIIRKRKSPPALDIKINNEDEKPSTVEEFIDYFFRKMAEKKKSVEEIDKLSDAYNLPRQN